MPGQRKGFLEDTSGDDGSNALKSLQKIPPKPWACGYLIGGMGYLLTHPRMLCKVLCYYLIILVVNLAATIALFITVLGPQARALERKSIPSGWAWLISVMLVITYSFLLLLITYLAVQACIEDVLFEMTFEYKKLPIPNHPSVCCTNCRYSIFALFVLLITLPLNVIPVIGQIMYATVNGWISGWQSHADYLSRRGMRVRQQKAYVSSRSMDYFTFGAFKILLFMVPLVNTLFAFTTIVGAALWAADLEQELLTSGAIIGANRPDTGANASYVPPSTGISPPADESSGSIQDLGSGPPYGQPYKRTTPPQNYRGYALDAHAQPLQQSGAGGKTHYPSGTTYSTA